MYLKDQTSPVNVTTFTQGRCVHKVGPAAPRLASTEELVPTTPFLTPDLLVAVQITSMVSHVKI